MQLQDPQQLVEYVDRIHARTRRVIERIPEDRLDWAPAEGWFSFGDLVRHLAGIERFMYAEAARGGPNRYPGHGRELADGRAAVLAYYDRLHAESRAIFAALTPDELVARCRTPDDASITTWKWLRAMIEHEAHHRGQLYLMLAIIGVPTPPLFGLTSEEVRARAKG